MKICVVTQTFPRFPGDPTAPFMTGVCQGLAKNRNNVFVLAPDSPLYKKNVKHSDYKLVTYTYFFPRSFQTLGYSQTLVNDKRFKKRVAILAPLMIFFCFIRLLQLVKKEKIDIVSAHWILPNGFIAAAVKLFTGVKVVSTLPGSDVYVAKKTSLFRAMALFSANFSDGITSNSLQLKEDLVKLGAKIKKFKPIIYGVDTKVFAPNDKKREKLRKKFAFKKTDVVVLGVGRLVEKKGFLYLVKAAKEIVKNKKRVHFVIVGDGSQKPLLQKEVKKSGLEAFVHFPGQIAYSELVDYYNLADIFILPSVRDAEGNLDDQSVAAIEAMSCGKAVITTDFPGYRLVIDHGKDGFLVPEKKTKKIAEIITTLAASSSLRKKVGKAARQKVINSFSWKQIGKEYTEFFKSLVDEK